MQLHASLVIALGLVQAAAAAEPATCDKAEPATYDKFPEQPLLGGLPRVGSSSIFSKARPDGARPIII